MAEMTTLEIELPKATAERLAEIARTSNLTTDALARQALDQLLEVDDGQRRAIQEAIAQADAGGPFIAHEDMVRWLDSWGTDNELEPPRESIRR